ncbi:MAG: thiamine pyrophosphate-dependent enzyme [Candidatus Omnitrophica bacterium]|nr:thiamine pyrophosphate-dependent enzyme [Candidatus Omnitrophota bacterium]
MQNKKKFKDIILSGNEALARGAYEAGVNVAAGYPGTPSSEILEYIKRFDEVDAQWSVNEKVAFEVAYGASIGGARSLYVSKHVGINVAMDPLMVSAYTGISAGFVIVTCDDPGVHSSQNEQDNRRIASFAKMPLIEPSSPFEAKELIKKAFDISEKYQTPVLFRMTTRICHSKENIILSKRIEKQKPPFDIPMKQYVMVPANSYPRHLYLEKRILRIKTFSEKTKLNFIENGKGITGFITSGVSYLYIKENYPDAPILKLGMSYPFPEKLALKFAKQVKNIIVVEELEPFIEEQMKMLAIKHKAKDPSYRVGELKSEFIPKIIQGQKKKEKKRTGKKPLFCAGCPHRPVFYVLKQLKVTVAGDIGCYALAAMPPLSSLHTCLCMGAGISAFEGIRRGRKEQPLVGVLGDSTFVHSGITGLINAAYNKQTGVIIILDNSTTAMTGCQPNPSTGITLKGEKTKKLSLEKIAEVSGADEVIVVDPFKIKELKKHITESLSNKKLTVIITRSPCKFIDKTTKGHVDYNIDKCKKCQVCLQIDCPAISKTAEGFIDIDSELCSGCGLCVEVCSFKALTKK